MMAKEMLAGHLTVPMSAESVGANSPCIDIDHIAGTESSSRERRRRLRVRVHWTISFFKQGTSDAVTTVTQNLSSDGFYCLVNTVFVPGEILACTLILPTYYPYERNQVRAVQCRVRVIRVEVLAAGNVYGVGCCIEDYSVLCPPGIGASTR